MADKMPETFPPDVSSRAYKITRVVVQIVLPMLGGITVIGAENIPESGPVILAPNHRAYMDPPYLSMVTKRQLHMMAKEELFVVPILGPLIKALDAFPVKRGSADRSAIRQAIGELKAGHVLGIFPEGKRADSGTLEPAEKGFALIARQTGVPIVPIALEGTDRVHPMHAKRLFRARVTATIGKPMTAAEMLAAFPDSSKDALTIIGEATTRAIAALMTEPVQVLTVAESMEHEAARSAQPGPEKNSRKKWLPLLTLVSFGVILLLAVRSKRRR